MTQRSNVIFNSTVIFFDIFLLMYLKIQWLYLTKLHWVYLSNIRLVYLKPVWCIWNWLSVFETWWVYLKHDECIWNRISVFENTLSVFGDPLSVFENIKSPNTLSRFQIHSMSVFERTIEGWTTTDVSPAAMEIYIFKIQNSVSWDKQKLPALQITEQSIQNFETISTIIIPGIPQNLISLNLVSQLPRLPKRPSGNLIFILVAFVEV